MSTIGTTNVPSHTVIPPPSPRPAKDGSGTPVRPSGQPFPDDNAWRNPPIDPGVGRNTVPSKLP